MSALYKFEPTKGELMAIKRKITEAGRLQDELEPQLKVLDSLKAEIKAFETKMAAAPETNVVLVSGEYVAELTGEAKQRKLNAAVNNKLLHRVGLEDFMKVVKIQVTDAVKLMGEAAFNAVAPPHFDGKGRRFKIVKRT